MNNQAILDQLFLCGGINLDRGALFQYEVKPKSAAFDFDKVEGMLLGVAIGDSLGAPSEGLIPSERRARYGEIRDYLPNKYVNEARGFPTDDTQLTFWKLEQLIEDRGFVPENVARKYATGGKIYGIGETVRGFLKNYKGGLPWHRSGPQSAGNGALMRISPTLLPHLTTGGTGLWVDTALAAMMTHNDRASTSACLALIAMLWEALDMDRPPAPRWWGERYVELTRDLEGNAEYSPRGGAFTSYRGPLWRFVEMGLSWAEAPGIETVEACNAWYSGAFLLETVPCVLLIMTRYADDPEEAIVRAVNDTRDNDTTAAIVGCLVGALHGKRGLPQRWIANLSGRTTDRDDGRIFTLIDQARRVFFE